MLVKHSNKQKGLLDRPKWYTEESYMEFLNKQNWWHSFLFPTLFTLTFVWNKSEKIKYTKNALKTIVIDKELVIRTVTFASKMGESTFPGALSLLSLWTLRETSLKLSFQRHSFSHISSHIFEKERMFPGLVWKWQDKQEEIKGPKQQKVVQGIFYHLIGWLRTYRYTYIITKSGKLSLRDHYCSVFIREQCLITHYSYQRTMEC